MRDVIFGTPEASTSQVQKDFKVLRDRLHAHVRCTMFSEPSGSVGRRVDAHLHALGNPGRKISRHNTVRFDWNDESTWEPARSSIDRMLLVAPDGTPGSPTEYASEPRTLWL